MNTLTENELWEVDGGFAPLSGGAPSSYIDPMARIWWESWLRNHAN